MTEQETTEPAAQVEVIPEPTPPERPAGDSALERAAEAALAMPGIPGRDEFLALAMQARILSMSGAAPEAVRGNPHLAFHIAMVGRDLGISPSAALSLVDVILSKKGPQLSLSPELMNGQIARLGLGSIVPVVRTEERAVAVALEPGGRVDYRCKRTWPDHQPDCTCRGVIDETEFTWHDAQVAGLAGKECRPGAHAVKKKQGRNNSTYEGCDCNTGYLNYPKRMMWWRAAGFCADDNFPTAGLGLYCLPTRAEALTRDGWRDSDKIEVGSEVLAYDLAAGVCRWVPVLATRIYEAAQTFRIQHARWLATATAEHRWVVERKGWPSNRRPGQVLRPTDELQTGEGSLVLAAPSEPQESVISVRDASLLGWVLTDGSISQSGRGGPCVSIQQSKHVEVVRRLVGTDARERLAVSAGVQTIRGKEYECRDHYTFRFTASFARAWMKRLGLREKADAIGIVTRLGEPERAAMLEAMLLANGHDAGNGPSGQKHITFHTGRRDVLDTFQALCMAHGQALGVERFQKGQETCWTVTLRRSRGVDVAALNTTPHVVEPVWCPTTSLGTWVARLDGYVFITGNSPEELGAVVDAEGRPIDPADVSLPEGYEPKQIAPPPRASDDDVKDLATRVRAFWDNEPARLAWQEMWLNQHTDGTEIREGVEALPKIPDLLARHVARAKAITKSIEDRIAKGEWATADAEVPQAVPERSVDPETGEVLPEPVQAALGDPGPSGGEEPDPDPDEAEVTAIAEGVKAAPLGEVRKRLREIHADDEGTPNEVRGRLETELVRRHLAAKMAAVTEEQA